MNFYRKAFGLTSVWGKYNKRKLCACHPDLKMTSAMGKILFAHRKRNNFGWDIKWLVSLRQIFHSSTLTLFTPTWNSCSSGKLRQKRQLHNKGLCERYIFFVCEQTESACYESKPTYSTLTFLFTWIGSYKITHTIHNLCREYNRTFTEKKTLYKEEQSVSPSVINVTTQPFLLHEMPDRFCYSHIFLSRFFSLAYAKCTE